MNYYLTQIPDGKLVIRMSEMMMPSRTDERYVVNSNTSGALYNRNLFTSDLEAWISCSVEVECHPESMDFFYEKAFEDECIISENYRKGYLQKGIRINEKFVDIIKGSDKEYALYKEPKGAWKLSQNYNMFDKNAIEFAEWLPLHAQPRTTSKNQWKHIERNVIVTTEELYDEFIQYKNKTDKG
jgi:hypothetical protein